MLKPQSMQRVWLQVLREDVPEAAIALADSGAFAPEFVTDPEQVLNESPSGNYRELYNRAQSRLNKIGAAASCPLPKSSDDAPRAVTLGEMRALDERLLQFRADPPAAAELLAIGQSPHDAKIDPTELAAYATVARIIMNLSEFITKG